MKICRKVSWERGRLARIRRHVQSHSVPTNLRKLASLLQSHSACFSRLFFAPCFSRWVQNPRLLFPLSALQRGFSTRLQLANPIIIHTLFLALACALSQSPSPRAHEPSPNPAHQPSSADIARIRADLQARRLEREAESENLGPLALQPLSAPPNFPNRPAQAVSQSAWLLLSNQMDQLRAIVTCEPIGTSATLRRAPLVLKGETWLALEPGRWRIRILAGKPDGQPNAKPVTITADFHRNRAYSLVFDKEVESLWLRERKALHPSAASKTDKNSSE